MFKHNIDSQNWTCALDLHFDHFLEYSPYLVVNTGLIIALIYGTYYVILEHVAGVRF